ncbi:hypothetical protein ACFWUP_23745 [Nocardia sp. NPDC058658]|uniref:hypothetical protein n=1 Tax=Nocardia sp. NPDC058658 TaxID=3346580 RepID=UPI0036592ACF
MRAYRLLAALLITVTAIVIAVFVVTATGHNPDPRPQVPPGVGAPATTVAASTSRPPTVDLFGNRLEVPATDSGVPLPQTGLPVDPTHADYLTAAPTGLVWQRIWDGAGVPVSSSDGPARIVDGVASGYARTPQGAILAGLDALGRALAAPDPTWKRVVADRFYGGGQPLIDRFARSRTITPDAARYVAVPDGVRVQPGFAPDMAVVEVATRASSGYAVSTWPMVWVDGDWRLRVPDDLESLWRPTTTRVPTSAGFGNWKPRS